MEITLNVILSLIKFLQDNIDSLGNVKTINRITPDEKSLPAIIIREGKSSSFKEIEIGSKQFMREMDFYFEVYATNDEERLDIKDKLIKLLRKNDIPLYSCDLSGDEIYGSLLNYMTVANMNDYRINFGEDLSNLDLIDRYRHLIIVSLEVGQIE